MDTFTVTMLIAGQTALVNVRADSDQVAIDEDGNLSLLDESESTVAFFAAERWVSCVRQDSPSRDDLLLVMAKARYQSLFREGHRQSEWEALSDLQQSQYLNAERPVLAAIEDFQG